MLFRYLAAIVTSAACWQLAIPTHAGDQTVFYSTDEFEITGFDLRMYLRGAPPVATGTSGSRARNLQALSDLYALRILGLDAEASSLLSDEEADWIATYEVTMEKVRRYLIAETEARMDKTDWQAEAREQYLTNKQDYVEPESITIRTLLVRTGDKTEEEASREVSALLEDELPKLGFEALVRTYTEDDAARESGGLMTNLLRGETVRPFEDAAFALTTPGEVSEPVISEFGVHLIQLLERQEAVQKSFEEVADDIIAKLKPIRAAAYRAGLQAEARGREPAGFTRNTQALDALVETTADGPLAPLSLPD